jgi:DNA-binding IclR family transcriptional regulator
MSEQAADDRPSGVQMVSRVAMVLRALADAPGGLSLSELAAAAGMPKSTVHRIVGALRAEDFVTPVSSSKIRLGRGIARLGAATRDALRDEIHPHLVKLNAHLRETVDVAVLEGDAVRLIDHISGPHRLLAVSTTGAALPVYCTANGKALLASLPDSQVDALIPESLTAVTEHTITSRAALWEELEQIRAAGFSFDREEYTPGITGVSAVVYDAYGPVAAIAVPVPTQRFIGKETHLTRAVVDACAAASEALGAVTPGRPATRRA